MNEPTTVTTGHSLRERLSSTRFGGSQLIEAPGADLFSTLLQVTNFQPSPIQKTETESAPPTDATAIVNNDDDPVESDSTDPLKQSADAQVDTTNLAAPVLPQVALANPISSTVVAVPIDKPIATVNNPAEVAIAGPQVETPEDPATKEAVKLPQTSIEAPLDSVPVTEAVVVDEVVSQPLETLVQDEQSRSNSLLTQPEVAPLAKPANQIVEPAKLTETPAGKTPTTVASITEPPANFEDPSNRKEGRRNSGRDFVGTQVNTDSSVNGQDAPLNPSSTQSNSTTNINSALSNESILNPATAALDQQAIAVESAANNVVDLAASKNSAAVAITQSALGKAADSAANGKVSVGRTVNGIVSNSPLGPARQANTTATADPTEGPNQHEAVQRAQLVKRVSRAFQKLSDGGGTVRVRLSPPNLGAVRIEVQMQESRMNARITTESEAARSVLNDNLLDLRSRLSELGIQVDRVEVVRESSTSGQQASFHDSAGNGDRHFEQHRQPPTINSTAREPTEQESDDLRPPSIHWRSGNPRLDVHV